VPDHFAGVERLQRTWQDAGFTFASRRTLLLSTCIQRLSSTASTSGQARYCGVLPDGAVQVIAAETDAAAQRLFTDLTAALPATDPETSQWSCCPVDPWTGCGRKRTGGSEEQTGAAIVDRTRQ